MGTDTTPSMPPVPPSVSHGFSLRKYHSSYLPTAIQPCAARSAIQPPPSPTAIRPRAPPTAIRPSDLASVPPGEPSRVGRCVDDAVDDAVAVSVDIPRQRQYTAIRVEPLDYTDTLVTQTTAHTPTGVAAKPARLQPVSGCSPADGCQSRARTRSRLRPVIFAAVANKLASNAATRSRLIEDMRLRRLDQALAKVGLALPDLKFPHARASTSGTEYMLNEPLKKILSEFVRRTRIPLPEFVELVRGQTVDDYRPNKNLVPKVISQLCVGYPRLDELQQIAKEGAHVTLTRAPPAQPRPPPNHGSTAERVNVLRKNIRKEQDAWRCLVLDDDLLEIWPEVFLGPFGVVDKSGGDPQSCDHVIHDLSFPEGTSTNDCTDQASIPRPEYQHCDAVAAEIYKPKSANPGALIKLMAGDVASAFRNVSIHSHSVRHFAGRIESEKAVVIEMSAPFDWTDSPGTYEVVGGAIAFVHGSHTNRNNPSGFFTYHWVNDHVNVAIDTGPSCGDMDRSLRYAMTALLGCGAVNDYKFSTWATAQTVLGLHFDSVRGTVSMPESKTAKACTLVAISFHADSLSRTQYRSLLGSLRHVATCIRPARPFLQRQHRREFQLHRFDVVDMSSSMRQDLLWWWHIIHSPSLNGVPLEYFNGLPEPDVVVEMYASDFGLCALDTTSAVALTYQFTKQERQLISDFKSGEATALTSTFGNSCHAPSRGHRWSQVTTPHERPVHVRFHIDNTSAVEWQNRLASRNARAQNIIRLLGY